MRLVHPKDYKCQTCKYCSIEGFGVKTKTLELVCHHKSNTAMKVASSTNTVQTLVYQRYAIFNRNGQCGINAIHWEPKAEKPEEIKIRIWDLVKNLLSLKGERRRD